MFTDIKKYKSTFIYMFTKFKKEERDEILPTLESILKNLNEDEKQNHNFTLILRDL